MFLPDAWISSGVTDSSKMAFISEGTPGSVISTAFFKSIRTPGAVPTGLGSGEAFSGNVAIFIWACVSSTVGFPFSLA